MKTISFKNTLKLALIVLIGGFMFISCDRSLNSQFVNDVQSGPDLALFKNTNKSVTKVADGSKYKIGVKVWVAGPHMQDVSGDITAIIKATTKGVGDGVPSTDTTVVPAGEGVNYSLPDTTITLKESNHYLGTFYFNMLTDGIPAPQKKPPTFKLKVVKVSGDADVISSGKPLTVTLNYGCASSLAGVYTVEGINPGIPAHTAKVLPDGGLGQYVTTSIGGWYNGGSRSGSLAPLHFGVKFSDVCGVITVKSTILGGYYSNAVDPNGSTKAVPQDYYNNPSSLKYFILKYKIDGLGSYKIKYTKKGPLPSNAALSHESSDVQSSESRANLPRVTRKLGNY